VLAPAFEGQRQLVHPPLGDQVGDGGRVEQHLARGHAAAARLVQQHLRHHAPQPFGQREAHLLAAVGRRLVDQPHQRRRGRVRRHRGDDQVPGGHRVNRDAHHLGRAQVVDHQDVGVLAQRAPRHHRHLAGVSPHLALADEAAAPFVCELDLALDGDDVVAARLVDQVDEGRDERRLPARPRAGHQDQPLGLGRQRLDLAREPKLVGRRGPGGDDPEDAARAAMVAEALAPDAAHLGHLRHPLGALAVLERLAASFGRQVEQQRLDLDGCQRPLAFQRRNLAVHAHGGPGLRHQVQGIGPAGRRQPQQPIDPREPRRSRDARRLGSQRAAREGQNDRGNGLDHWRRLTLHLLLQPLGARCSRFLDRFGRGCRLGRLLEGVEQRFRRGSRLGRRHFGRGGNRLGHGLCGLGCDGSPSGGEGTDRWRYGGRRRLDDFLRHGLDSGGLGLDLRSLLACPRSFLSWRRCLARCRSLGRGLGRGLVRGRDRRGRCRGWLLRSPSLGLRNGRHGHGSRHHNGGRSRLPVTAHLDPDVVAPPGGNHRKTVPRAAHAAGQLVLDGPQLVERRAPLCRQQLAEHAGNGVERQRARRQLDGTRRRDHVRPLADVHHQRVTISPDDGGQERTDHVCLCLLLNALQSCRPKGVTSIDLAGPGWTWYTLTSSTSL